MRRIRKATCTEPTTNRLCRLCTTSLFSYAEIPRLSYPLGLRSFGSSGLEIVWTLP